jgi:hypothetical protein
VEGSSIGLVPSIPLFAWKDPGKPQKPSVRIVRFWTKIWTQNFQIRNRSATHFTTLSLNYIVLWHYSRKRKGGKQNIKICKSALILCLQYLKIFCQYTLCIVQVLHTELPIMYLKLIVSRLQARHNLWLDMASVSLLYPQNIGLSGHEVRIDSIILTQFQNKGVSYFLWI